MRPAPPPRRKPETPDLIIAQSFAFCPEFWHELKDYQPADPNEGRAWVNPDMDVQITEYDDTSFRIMMVGQPETRREMAWDAVDMYRQWRMNIRLSEQDDHRKQFNDAFLKRNPMFLQRVAGTE